MPAPAPVAPVAMLLSVDAAAHLGLKPQTLRKWRITGVGPAYFRIGGRVGYKLADIDAWLATRRFTSTASEAAARS